MCGAFAQQRVPWPSQKCTCSCCPCAPLVATSAPLYVEGPADLRKATQRTQKTCSSHNFEGLVISENHCFPLCLSDFIFLRSFHLFSIVNKTFFGLLLVVPLHDTLNPNASTCAPCTSYLNSTCRLPGTRWAPPRRLTTRGASRATQRHCAADQRVAGVRLAGRVPRDGGLCERCQALSAIPC